MKCATEAEPFFSPAGAQYDSPGQGGPSRRRPGCPASMSYEGLKGRRNTQHGARHRVPFHYIALSGLTTCRATLTQGCALGYRTVGPTGLHNILAKDGKPLGVGERAIWGLV